MRTKKQSKTACPSKCDRKVCVRNGSAYISQQGLGEVMRLVKKFETRIRVQNYENEVLLMVEVRKSVTEAFLLKSIQGVQMVIMEKE